MIFLSPGSQLPAPSSQPGAESRGFRVFLLLFLATVSANSSEALKQSARYEFQYKVRMEIPKKGMNVRIWIPSPLQDAFQQVHRVSVVSPLKWRMVREKKYGNRILFLEGVGAHGSLDLSASFEVTRFLNRGIKKENIKEGSSDEPSLFLKPDVRGPLTQIIRKIASEQTRSTHSDMEKIRSLYDYIVKTMTYDKSGTGWGNGDAIWACSTKRGNCTDFHSLFIALSRSVNVPSRFFIGFGIRNDLSEGEIPGYHCWAEAFSKESGWVPLDASEAKRSGQFDRYFGQLPPDRIAFTLGRDLVLEPPQRGAPLNYFIYPYVEVDGKPLETLSKEFRFKRL